MAEHNRLRLKQSPTDIWSVRERLALASSVMRSGDQNWVSVSRAVRPFGMPGRPTDWFSQINCARQYSDLLEKVEAPRRKRGEREVVETPGDIITRKLTIERIEELKKIIADEAEKYRTLKKDLEMARSGQLDGQMKELWEKLQAEKAALAQAATKKAAEEAAAREQAKLIALKTKKQHTPPSVAKVVSDVEDSTQDSIFDPSPNDDSNMSGVSSLPTPGQTSVTGILPSSITSQPSTNSLFSSPDGQQLLHPVEGSSSNLFDGNSSSQVQSFADQLLLEIKQEPSSSDELARFSADELTVHLAPANELAAQLTAEKETSPLEIIVKTEVFSPANGTCQEDGLPASGSGQLKIEDQKTEATSFLKKGNLITTVDHDVSFSLADEISTEIDVKIGEEEVEIESNENHHDEKEIAYLQEDEKDLLSQESEIIKTEVVLTEEEIVPIKSCETEEVEEEMSPASSVVSTEAGSVNSKLPHNRVHKAQNISSKRRQTQTRQSEEGKESEVSSKPSEAETSDDEMARSHPDDSSFMSSLRPRLDLNESLPNSPASISHSDTEDERAHKVWKKSIMLVWRAASNHKFANIFLHPVTEDIAPGYHSVVFRPMDLHTIRKNIDIGVIRTTAEFQRDMMLMFTNAIMYNNSTHDVHKMARTMYQDVMSHIEITFNAFFKNVWKEQIEFHQQFVSTQMMVQAEPKLLRTLRRTEAGVSDKEEDTKKRKLSEHELAQTPTTSGVSTKKRKV